MKKLLAVLTAIVAGVSALFAQTVVSTDAEIRSAVQVNNANIQLGADIDLSNSTLSIPSNHTVTLDLNGHRLDRKLIQRGAGGGQVITVRQGATLNLSNGTLTGGWGGAGGALVNEGGTVTLTDVIISNNVADDRGGGICNRNGGVLTMTNCTITDNHSNDHSGAKGGGGFFNEENATATLTNVIITGNEAKVCGGGGICNFGTLTLDGCTIQNNAAITNGGGIWQEGTLNVQGANIVTGNTTVDNKPNNLFLKTGALLTVTGSLAGSTILVDMESGTGTLTSGYNTHNSGVDPATFFQSEWPDIMDVTLENNEAKLGSSLAEGDYYYIDNHWSDGKLTYETKILHQGEYKLIKPGYYEDTDLNMSGTYVVVTNDKGYKCHYDGIAYVTASTKIILCDGAKLEINGCLLVAENEVVLDVYGQVNNTGVLQAHGDITHYGENYPGIGSGQDKVTDMHFHGGHIIAKGENSYAGIGAGHIGENNSKIYFYNANVEATGGSGGAGIGTWNVAKDYDDLEVYIYGGTIKAWGGSGFGDKYAAGIGGGEDGYGSWVIIYGGTVVAKTTGTDEGSRAIGPGDGSDDYNTLDIGDDMMVISERKFTAAERKNACWYRTNVRVEVCDHSDGFTYTVDGTGPNDHHISHCPYCLHTDTALHTFDANGVCTVCGVHTTAYAAKLYMPQAQPDGSFDGQTYSITNTHLVVPDSVFRLPMATLNVPGLKFIGWEALEPDPVTGDPSPVTPYISPYTTATADTLYRVGNTYKVSGNICFVARYKVADIYLYDDQPNGETLNEYNNMTVSKVILSGRVFNKNNTWQSLALPFSLSAEELATSPLAGCTLKQLDTDSSYNDTENKLVYLYFKEATSIEAGKPYIIRWTEGNPILSPEFENVTLTNKTADAKARLLMYKSLYSPQTFTSANKMVLYFREDGVLVYPNGQEPVTVGAFRAYFRLTNLMGADPDVDFTITSNLGDTQGIDPVTGNPSPVTLKIIRNGLLFIEKNGKIYNAQGAEVK